MCNFDQNLHQLLLCFFGDCAIQRVRDNHQGQEFVQLDAGHVKQIGNFVPFLGEFSSRSDPMVKPLRSGSQPQPQPASDRPGGLKDAGSVSCQLKVYPPRDFMQVSSFFLEQQDLQGFENRILVKHVEQKGKNNFQQN